MTISEYCHHPQDQLESVRYPGMVHCQACHSTVECPHPFHHLVCDHLSGSVVCHACTEVLFWNMVVIPFVAHEARPSAVEYGSPH